MRASHGGKSVHLGCPHRQTGRWIRGQDVRRGARRPEPFRSDPSFAGFSLFRAVAGVRAVPGKCRVCTCPDGLAFSFFGPGMGVSVLQWLAAGKGEGDNADGGVCRPDGDEGKRVGRPAVLCRVTMDEGGFRDEICDR